MGVNQRYGLPAHIVHDTGFVHKVFTTGQFNITTYLKSGTANKDMLVVYIEGDGNAFERRAKLSSDPTPKSPVALKLAVQDPHSAILYVARPCQYLPVNQLRDCDPKYWSTHRYSEEAVTAINEVINMAAPEYRQIGLIGYSGGGTVAALLAARRKDVLWLATVAANLDHQIWTMEHGVTPLTGSLNAADYAVQIAELPQLHLAGEKDRTVPVSVIQSFMRRIPTSKAMLEVIPGYDHHCCWDMHWPGLLCKLETDYCLK